MSKREAAGRGWSVRKLAELLDIENWATLPEVGVSYRYLGLEHIEQQTGRIIDAPETNGSSIQSQKYFFNPTHVLYGKLRPYLNKVAMPDFTGVCSTDILPLAVRGNASREYVAFFLRSASFVHHAVNRSTGTKMPRLGPRQLLRITIPLPPLPAQERIVQILHKADEIRRKRQDAVEQADAILASLFHEMLGNPEDGTIDYDVKPLSELVKGGKKGIKCGPFGSQLHISELTQSGIPVLGIENVEVNRFLDTKNKFVTPEKYKALRSCRVEPGDVLITRTGTAGRACVVPEGFPEAIIGPNLLKVSPDPEELLPEVLSLAVNFNPSTIHQIKRFSPGSTVAVFNVANLKRVLFTVPPVSIQEEFLRRHTRLSEIRLTLVDSLNTANATSESLLSRAFTGDLTAEWEAANADWIAAQVELQARLPRLLLLALIRDRAARIARRAAQAAILVTALMKYAFLLQMEGNGRRRFYQFVPYHYGPFAKEVYADLERLQADGIVTVDENADEEKIRIVLADPDKADAALADLPDELRRDVAAILNAYGNLGHTALLKTVYEKYPAYARKSRTKRRPQAKRGG